MSYQIYKCNKCGGIFVEPEQKIEYENHSELAGEIGPKYETLYEEVCPNCGSTDIEGSYRCECCDQGYGEYYESGFFCDECIELVDEMVMKLMKDKHMNWKTAVSLVNAWSEKHW